MRGVAQLWGVAVLQRVAVGNERFTSEIITRRFLQCKWENAKQFIQYNEMRCKKRAREGDK